MRQFALYIPRVCLSCWSIILICTNIAIAQQPSDTVDLKSPEKSSTIWRLQAKTTAKEFGLSKPEGEKLAESYVAVRTRRSTLLKELPKEIAGGSGHRKNTEETDTEQREQLKTAIGSILNEEQIETAILSLGSFNPRWDRYVSQIQGFQLDERAQDQALRLTLEYIVNYGKARAAAKAEDTRLSSVVARDLKSKLDKGLAAFLSEEQSTKWNEATAFRSGGATRAARNTGKQGGRKSD